MREQEWLAQQFEEKRGHLRSVAYRTLGSLSEAEDAVQEAWLRLSRSNASDVENLGGWLTTVVARVCLDMLRSRGSRREETLDSGVSEPIAANRRGTDPEQEALLADSVGLALLVVLDRLTPAERLAFVLHDMFAVPFDEIADCGAHTYGCKATSEPRPPARARSPTAGKAELAQQQEVVTAFLTALRATILRIFSRYSTRMWWLEWTKPGYVWAHQGRFAVQ